ncbi:MAG: integrin alpha [Candidatus Nitrotoga sp.]
MIFSINLSTLNGSNGFRLDGEAAPDFSGYSVSTAGDVNGDGFDDVIVGAPRANSNNFSSGSSYVVFGQASGFSAAMDLSNLNGINGFRLNGEALLDTSGSYGLSLNSVSNAGDINGDGFDDMLVGARLTDRYGGIYSNDAGYSYVIFGKSSGFSPAMNLSSLNGSNGFRFTSFSSKGSNVSSAGDINGDGFDDFIIGAPRPGLVQNYSSVSYIVFGKAGGFNVQMNLFSLDGSNGFRLVGETLYDSSGSSVSNAGDVNGDGFDDLIVGADTADPNGKNSGSSYVVFGQASGFSATMNLSSLNGSNGFRLDGETANDYSGASVSTAGDVNGDGFDDLIVGAHGADPNGSSSGSSYVVFGQASGFSAAMDLSSLDGSNGFRLDGETAYDRSGYSVSNAGDVNGDGFDDVIIGADRADSNGASSGSSYVVFGQASGFSAAMNLSSLNGSNGFRLGGEAAGDESGHSVSNAGDVNGDGFDDLIVGAFGADPNGYASGSSYVVFGRSNFGSGLPEILGTAGDDTLKGTMFAEHFTAGDGNDKLIGRGGADSFEGGAGNDKIQVADLSFASVDGGAGIDVLHLAGTGLNLNLADSGDRISDIEIISLYSQGASNTLTLTAADLRDLSNTTNTLKVNGNAGGHIIVEDSGWIDGGNRGGGYYHVYTQDDAVLLVGQNLTVDFVAA